MRLTEKQQEAAVDLLEQFLHLQMTDAGTVADVMRMTKLTVEVEKFFEEDAALLRQREEDERLRNLPPEDFVRAVERLTGEEIWDTLGLPERRRFPAWKTKHGFLYHGCDGYDGFYTWFEGKLYRWIEGELG
jgi:hypothetical protein